MVPSLYWHMFGAGLVSFIIARCIMASILQLITEAGFVRPNFRGEQIPVGAGLLFFLSALLPVGLLLWLDAEAYRSGAFVYLFAMGTMTLLGLTDDVFGSRADSGLKGHLKKLFKGQLTTGGLKLVFGGVMALVVASSFHHSITQLIIHTVVIALSVNAINLLDLRPGRAGKGFLLGIVLLLWGGGLSHQLIWAVITTGALLAYLPADLRARSMMGDTGSNALGATIGITAVFVLPQTLLLGYLGALVIFHLFTERYSLTKVIERNKVLNYLDQLGRNQ